MRVEDVKCAGVVGVSYVPSFTATSTDYALRACPGRLINPHLSEEHCIPREIITDFLITQFTVIIQKFC